MYSLLWVRALLDMGWLVPEQGERENGAVLRPNGSHRGGGWGAKARPLRPSRCAGGPRGLNGRKGSDNVDTPRGNIYIVTLNSSHHGPPSTRRPERPRNLKLGLMFIGKAGRRLGPCPALRLSLVCSDSGSVVLQGKGV